jgi:hypothetical protein
VCFTPHDQSFKFLGNIFDFRKQHMLPSAFGGKAKPPCLESRGLREGLLGPQRKEKPALLSI